MFKFYSQIAGRILNRSFEKVGMDFRTGVLLDSDIFSPYYNYRVELREPNLPPSSTLMLKVSASFFLCAVMKKTVY